MRINVLDNIKDYEGNIVKDRKVDSDGNQVLENNRPVFEPQTLRTIFIQSLNSTAPGETLTAESKAQIYYLSTKLYSSKEVDLTESDRDFIKDRVSKIYNSPLIYGRICDLFDAKGTVKKEDENSK